MSVRRLAEDAVQPEGFKFNREKAAEAKLWIKKYPKGRQQSAVIPLLMLAQEQDGWVTKAAIEHVSEMLEMPRIRVMEVATFYTQFMLQPVGTKAHVQVCGTTPCMLRGAEDLKKVCQNKINRQQFQRNGEGTLSWEEVECQGACVNAPMVMIGRDTYEDLTPERLEEIIDAFEAGKGDTITPGPQIDRIYSAPVGGPLTLLDDVVASTPKKKAPAKKAAAKKKAVKAAEPVASENPTMKLATTASKVAPKAKKTKGVQESPINTKLSAIDVEEVPSTKDAKPAKNVKITKGAQGTDPGTVLENVKGASSVKPKAAPKKKVTGGNPTMKIAATAAGRAAKGKSSSGPVRMEKPKGKADDLKLIAGVGPKLEQTLNSLGFWHFHQIAAWTADDIAVVDDQLRFKGRIERDDWVKQAAALAKGGRDEYVKVFGKEPR
ncbi:MAG: NADH-quinone oxidoreductase subunit NuoE [Pseudomonadota bacterium]